MSSNPKNGSDIAPKPRLQHLLWGGYAAIILLLALSWLLQLRQVEQSQGLIEASRVASEKMEVITSLIEVARSRTRMTSQMLVVTDPFEKDAIQLRLDEEATQFVVLRERLQTLGLSEQEQAIMEENGEYVRPTLEGQRRAAEMALSDDPDVLREAHRILMAEVLPMQGKIIDNFMLLFKTQRRTIQQATEQAGSHYQQVVVQFTTLTGATLGLAVFIALLVLRKTASIEQALHRARERAQVTLGSIGDAVIATDALARVQYMNPMAELLTGYRFEKVKNLPIGRIFTATDEADGRSINEYVYTLAQHGAPRHPSDDVVLRNANGEELHIALTLAAIREVDNRIGGVILSFQDVTESRQLARHVEFHAQHDALTGLLNRRAFEERVNQSLAIYNESTHYMCVVDLDRFKLVNDSCGHAAGDELLRQLSTRLRAEVRKGDLVARMGGDEFAFFLLNVGREAAVELGDKLLATVREYRFLWDGKTFRVGASIGMVESPVDVRVDFAHLLQAADAGCYQAKHQGRDRAVMVPYDGATLAAQRLEGEWVRRITDAIESDSFELHSQPIVPLRAACDSPAFHEVLLRMRDEQGGLIQPMSFLPHAERYNLMPRIDAWVVRRVVKFLAGCEAEHSVYFINLSGQSMGDQGFAESIVQLIESSGVDPSRLCFELTETAAIANLEVARRFMDLARGMGCLIALDDFGSGLSSFAYIKNLQLDLIKIDGEFIRQLASDKTSRVMVEAIHGIAGALGLCTVAEFVENDAVLDILREIGIDMAQGYHLARPAAMQCGGRLRQNIVSGAA